MSTKRGVKRIVLYFIACLLVVIAVGWAGARWFERNNLYVPYRKIEAVPQAIGLEYKDFTLKIKTGETVAGWWIPAAKSRATVVLCHGNGGNISHRLEKIAILNHLGLTVAIFDYPGYGQSAGHPHESNLYASAEAVCKMVQEDKKSAKLILYGESLGAAVAIEMATRVHVDALIVESGFTNTVNIGKEFFPFMPVRLLISQTFDSLAKIPGIHVPKLIIHSPQDEIIPYHHAAELYNASVEPKTLLTISGGHNDGFQTSGAMYVEGLRQFLAKTIGSA